MILVLLLTYLLPTYLYCTTNSYYIYKSEDFGPSVLACVVDTILHYMYQVLCHLLISGEGEGGRGRRKESFMSSDVCCIDFV